MIMNKYSILIALAATLVGCGKDVSTPEEWGDINIPLDPSKHYIHFDADVSTRGALVEGNVLNADFMVFGYQYPGWWEAESVLASPNVFVGKPQLVEYKNGVFTYGTPETWTGNRYAFFAYYPANSTKIKYFDNNELKQGDPYITYELASRTSSLGHIDVMTAAYVDTGVASSASVPLEFHHRLTAIDVGARNFYEYDLNGTMVPVTIEITELQIIFNNLVNNSAKIYLDHNIPSVYTPEEDTFGRIATYTMVHSNTVYGVKQISEIIPNTKQYRDMQFITDDSGNNASAIIVIPQTEPLEIGGSIKYRKRYSDNGEYKYIPNPEDGTNIYYKELSMTFDKKLQEGRRYFIEFTFTSDAVSINVVAADEWDDKSDIRYEFE